MSWAEIKKALNSTIGTPQFLSLDKMRGFAVFDEPGSYTWTPPEGVSEENPLLVHVTMIGGGGGGGGSWGVVGSPRCGGGGGSGLLIEEFVLVSGSVDVVCGIKGAGGTSVETSGVSTNGSSGGTSSFGSLLSQGGGGGARGVYSADANVGGGIGGNGGSGGGGACPGSNRGGIAYKNFDTRYGLGGYGGTTGGSGSTATGGRGGSGANGDASSNFGVLGVGGGGGGGYGFVKRADDGNAFISWDPSGKAGLGWGAGGGGSSRPDSSGGNGASGVVIIRW